MMQNLSSAHHNIKTPFLHLCPFPPLSLLLKRSSFLCLFLQNIFLQGCFYFLKTYLHSPLLKFDFHPHYPIETTYSKSTNVLHVAKFNEFLFCLHLTLISCIFITNYHFLLVCFKAFCY